MMGWHRPVSSNKCPGGLMKCLFEEVVVMEYMVYFNFFACVLIPLLLMLGIYLCIFMAARHQLKLIEVKAVHGEKSRSMLQKEIQAAKSLAIIVGLFAVCWLPLHIINCFTLFCPTCARPPLWIMYVAIILSHANSVINPFIYAYRIREFRQTFRKIIQRHILGRQEPLQSRSSKRSTHNSVRDSVGIRANGLSLGPLVEQSNSTSSRGGSYPCPAHMSPVGGGLMTASSLPLSVVIAHCPKMRPCSMQDLRQSHSAVSQGCTGSDVVQDGDKQNLRSGQAVLLFKRQSCFSELEKAS